MVYISKHKRMKRKQKENLTSFRYIRKNMKEAKRIQHFMFGYEHVDYQVLMNSGSIVYIRVENIECFGGGLFASIMDEGRNMIVEWSQFNQFFRGHSRRLARKLYYHYWFGNGAGFLSRIFLIMLKYLTFSHLESSVMQVVYLNPDNVSIST